MTKHNSLPWNYSEHSRQHGGQSAVRGWAGWYQIQVEDCHHHPQSPSALADTALQHYWWSDHPARSPQWCG